MRHILSALIVFSFVLPLTYSSVTLADQEARQDNRKDRREARKENRQDRRKKRSGN